MPAERVRFIPGVCEADGKGIQIDTRCLWIPFPRLRRAGEDNPHQDEM
jgi:hypothetical protein